MIKYLMASDHWGLNIKKKITDSFEVEDLGPFSDQSVDYPEFAHKLSKIVSESSEGVRGILICGSGIGMSIVANRYKGVRAALCHNTQQVVATRKHNDANVLCLSAKDIEIDQLNEMIEAFQKTEAEKGRHERRRGLIDGDF